MSIRRTRRAGHRFHFRPTLEGMEIRRLLAVTITPYPLPNNETPDSIIVGPDHNLWFTVFRDPPDGHGIIGMIDPTTGVIKQYETPLDSYEFTPASIVSGPGGDLWFIDSIDFRSDIASIDPATGAIQEYPIPASSVDVAGLAVGSDGNLWFTEYRSIGMFSPTTHSVTKFALPINVDGSELITPGPDGHLWFTASLVPPVTGESGDAIGDIDPTTHAITVTALPSFEASPTTITAGPDGNVWFNEEYSEGYIYRIASISTTTHAVAEYMGGNSAGITTGPDGNLWTEGENFFTDEHNRTIDNFNPTTHVSSWQVLPASISDSQGGPTIVTGPDGNLWFTAQGYIVSAHIIPANQSALTGSLTGDPAGSGTSTMPLYYHTVYIDLMGDGKLDPGDPIANTDALGYYTFGGLAPGTYTVRAAPYPGTSATFPAAGGQAVTVAGGQIGTVGPLRAIPSSSLLPLNYSPTPFGTANPDVQTAEVNGLYETILGRAPDPTGGANAVAYLKGGGSLAQLSGDLLTSLEYDDKNVDSFYQDDLGRAPSPAEEAAGVSLLRGGGTQDQLAAMVFDSAEFDGLHAAEPAFVTQLYIDILGRSPLAPEVSAWVGRLDAGMTRSAVVGFFLTCIESDTRALVGQFDILFGDLTDQVDPTNYLAALQAGASQINVAVSLYSNDQFIVRAIATVK